VGLGAAGLLATTMGIGLQTAMATLDGVGLAASIGVMWGLARFVSEPNRRRALQLGGWVALGASVRPMTAALGAAAVAVALVIIAVEAIKERGGLKAAVTAS